MEATELLRLDHESVRSLFLAFENAGDDLTSKRSLFEQIREQLAVHARLEHEILYPAVRDVREDKDDAEELIDDATDEHDDVDALLEEIVALDPTDRRYVRKVRKLQKEFEHHAAEEEQRLFPFAHRHLGLERLIALGRQIEARRAELGPRRPNAEVG